jgi:thiol:disulfide interchange protein DsbA
MKPYRRMLLAALASMLLAAPVLAQKKPEQGIDYNLISPSLPPESNTSVEVIEFFWYGCPHCYAFEPAITPWIKTLRGDVTFHRVPAVFHESWTPHAKLYYALEALGETDRLHKTVFDAIHQDKQQLATEASIAEFLEKHGIPRKKFTDAFNSFTVQSKIQRSLKLQAAYKIDGVPAMAVDGRYVTSNTMVGGSHGAVLPVVDYLIVEARKQKKLPKAADGAGKPQQSSKPADEKSKQKKPQQPK